MNFTSRLITLIVEKAQAADPGVPTLKPVSTNIDPGNGTGFLNIVTNKGGTFILILETIAGLLAVIYFIWYGIQYITSGGSPEKAKAARQGIINGVIGVAIITAAYALIRLGIAIANTVNNVISGPTPAP